RRAAACFRGSGACLHYRRARDVRRRALVGTPAEARSSPPNPADRRLVSLTSALPVDELNALPASIAAATRRLIERFGDALAARGMRLDAAGGEAAALPRVFALSPFVAEYAIGEPAEFIALLASLTAPVEPALEVARCLAGTSDEDEARRRFRRLRNRELVRIAWLDLTGRLTLEQTVAALSALADALIAGARDWLTTAMEQRYGRALDERGEPMRLIVLAMGKLGGEELNFSSDVDLVFLYRGEGE